MIDEKIVTNKSDKSSNRRKRDIFQNSSQPQAIAQGLVASRGIAVDWIGKNLARLDGTMRRTLVERSLVWPTGLAIDYAADRIYWTDPKAATIETIDINGKNRHIVKTFNSSEDKPYKIEVFEDNLFVSTFHNNAIFRLNK
ncbi:unnamed protein product, partial [Medioppia subpectinata]